MKLRKHLSILFIVFFLPLIMTCDEMQVTVKVKVISAGGQFTGVYTLDGDDMVTFESIDEVTMGTYEETFEIENQIEILAIPENTELTYLSIKLYRSSELVKEIKDESPTVTSVNLIYEIGEDDQTPAE